MSEKRKNKKKKEKRDTEIEGISDPEFKFKGLYELAVGLENSAKGDKKLKGFYMGEMVPGNTYEWGNCTYWAYAMRVWAGNPIGKWWGNANTWDDSARNEEYVVNHTPAVGAVFQTDEGEWGHVAYVIKVDAANGEWTISEMNAPNLNVVSQRTFPKQSATYYTFIHDKKGAPTWTPQPISNTLLPTGN